MYLKLEDCVLTKYVSKKNIFKLGEDRKVNPIYYELSFLEPYVMLSKNKTITAKKQPKAYNNVNFKNNW